MMETAYLARRIYIKKELIKNLIIEINQLQITIEFHQLEIDKLEETLARQNSQQAVGKT